MDLEILRKKLSTYRGPSGRIRGASDELLYELLTAWENWSGPMSGFYKSLGVSRNGMASMIGKAKKLKREGHFPESEFKEIKMEPSSSLPGVSSPSHSGIILRWSRGQVIRFPHVDGLIEFLNKTDKTEKKAS